jgi:hypothetical protein
MRTQTCIWLASVCAAAFAAYKGDLAAFCVAIAGGCLMYVMHGVEFKLNALLDQRGIIISPHDIAKD